MTYRAIDGETFRLEQRGVRVSFVKGVVDSADMTSLATAALDPGVVGCLPTTRLPAGQ